MATPSKARARRRVRIGPAPAAVAARIASTQDGCLTRSQLEAAGLSERQIDTLIDQAVLATVLGGTYLVGARSLSHRQLLRCALLTSDHPTRGTRHSGLSHRTGCEERGLLPQRPGVAEVTTDRRGLRPYQRTWLPMRQTGMPGEVLISRVARPLHETCVLDEHDGLTLLPLPRTLIDLAARHGRWDTRRAWREADYQRMLEPADVVPTLEYGRRKGVSVVRAIWKREGIVGADADLRSRGEMRFLKLLLAAGLPRPRVNARLRVGGRVLLVDFYWPEYGVAIEVDGAGHLRRFAEDDDADRDVALHADDVEVLRFTGDDIRARRTWALSLVEAAIAARR